MTVGVIVMGFNRTRGVPLKASEGAEKSCRLKRRRKRGLRKGKRRSRGCHPRRSAPAATVPKSTSRAILHHLRCCDRMTLEFSQLGKTMRNSYMEGKFNPEATPRILFNRYLGKWVSKRDHFLGRQGGGRLKPALDAASCFSFRDFVRKWCSARVSGQYEERKTPKGPSLSVPNDLVSFHDLLKHVKKNVPTNTGNRPGVNPNSMGVPGRSSRSRGKLSSVTVRGGSFGARKPPAGVRNRRVGGP